jgi:hypothetical protein
MPNDLDTERHCILKPNKQNKNIKTISFIVAIFVVEYLVLPIILV